jgi:hypothetical protein
MKRFFDAADKRQKYETATTGHADRRPLDGALKRRRWFQTGDLHDKRQPFDSQINADHHAA